MKNNLHTITIISIFSMLIAFTSCLLFTRPVYADDSDLGYKEAPTNYFEQCEQKGEIVKENYNSINGDNTLNVYLPYQYDSNKQYNIFYLMHGGGENENTIFSDDVKIHHMLDHMIMNKDIEPLIVVTPTFNKCDSRTFYKELRESVIPFVEGKYSTYAKSTSNEDIAASRLHRAFGGFSMGAASTWAVAINCLDIVGYLMPLSGDNWEASDATSKATTIADAINKFKLEKNQYFIFCATGSDDLAYNRMNPQMEEMKKLDCFSYTSDFSKGNFYYLVAPNKTHWWGYVRHYIYDGLPLFFKADASNNTDSSTDSNIVTNDNDKPIIDNDSDNSTDNNDNNNNNNNNNDNNIVTDNNDNSIIDSNTDTSTHDDILPDSLPKTADKSFVGSVLLIMLISVVVILFQKRKKFI